MPERDSFDHLLDEALGTYAEPALGLESRILRRLATSNTHARRLRLAWAIALPLAACALLLVYSRTAHSPAPIAHQAIPQAPVPETRHPQAPAAMRAAASSGHHAVRTQHTPALPKLDQFPAPSPLTAQEQALIHFVENTPPAEQIEIARAQQKIAEPLRVAAIQIPPINPPAEGKE